MNLNDVNDYIEANLVHSLHVTERRSFRGCRRRWNWGFREMYYPFVTPTPLEFGIAFHKAGEHWYDPDAWGVDDESRKAETLQVFKLVCDQQLKDYIAKHKSNPDDYYELDPEVKDDYDSRYQLGFSMLRQMFRQSEDLDRNFRPIGVETNFEVPIKTGGHEGDQLWCKCNRCWQKWHASKQGALHHDRWQESIPVEHWRSLPRNYYHDHIWKGLPVTLGGRIDMLAMDIYGRYWIFDWKTAIRLSTGEPGAPDDFLWLDDQISSYCWAFWVLGIDVAGFVYHEQKKALGEEPEPLLRPRLGCLYSQSKSKNYQYDTYLRTVRENDPGAYRDGRYDDFLEYLKTEGSQLYKRHQIKRNTHELEEIGRNLALEAMEMTDPGLRLYPSPGRFGCNGCAFREPCLMKNRGEDYQYTLDTLFEKRKKLYYETAEPSTDKPDRV